MSLLQLFAQVVPDKIPTCTTPGQTGCVSIPKPTGNQLLVDILNISYLIVGMIAVVMIIMVGYSYLTANGNPEKATKGK